MKTSIGIRREDKNIWERRSAIIPEHLSRLREALPLEAICQPFQTRAFSDEEYERAGARIQDDLSPCAIIFGIKEIPIERLMPRKTYLFFSHTIKGQPYNMPMLARLLELGCTLIDYELIKDANGRRLVFFGRFAGMAGMVDTLHTLGLRLRHIGYDTPLTEIRMAYQYRDIAEAKAEVKRVGNKIAATGLPKAIRPMVIGFSGYGHVSKGAQEVFDLLPHQEVEPQEISALSPNHDGLFHKVVFAERDMVRPIDPGKSFELNDYFERPEGYLSQFEAHLPHLSALVNGIYWDNRYPRLLTKHYLKTRWAQSEPLKLQVVGDISCDINGSIECTEKATAPDHPMYVYDPRSDSIRDGVEGEGVVILAVDNLPAEVPRDASRAFSESLLPFMPAICMADYTQPLEALKLPPEIKNAILCHQGALSPAFRYLREHLNKA
ncbi:MAG TPA: bifunctional lysine ketoglutarate reductase /saccharopine dehydrogenase family protein [bacterium]|nr:bifunctional lysine ketoglutarate reductase /saccharopine dehydrogenase family protein [bacterium]HQI49266.1 bifunctional lysine ketoglutarate reductase /saccharopine dehydrogenase family protein [bacterium]HQJ63652.1 bifunctional lysine ketoglutarate reductase /saccharopine dehydrogenase family protein [bacterium]